MPEYAEKLIKRHCMIYLGRVFTEAMNAFRFVPQRRCLEPLSKEMLTDIPAKFCWIFITNDWIEKRSN